MSKEHDDKRGVKVDAWKLYCEAFRSLFPSPSIEPVDIVSPAALQEMVDGMLATGGVLYQAMLKASAPSHVAPNPLLSHECGKNMVCGICGSLPIASFPSTIEPNAEHRWSLMPKDLHPATKKLVFQFAMALADKLHSAEQKYGYSDGWLTDDWMDECRAKLLEHIEKGDPRDVAAYCAFLWHHKQPTYTGVSPRSAIAPNASSKCPICGRDQQHAHSDEQIHAWLKAQAGRFGITVFVCNETDSRAKEAFALSEQETADGRRAFEAWFKPRYGHLSHCTLSRNDQPGAKEQYTAIATQANWDLWQVAWAAALNSTDGGAHG